jgi:chemotaxis signal transduction protein
MLGTLIDEPWASDALSVSGTQSCSVSPFRPSPLYDGRPTFIFAAGIRSAQGRCLGGIAVVFDTAPQLAAMLQDAIPKDESGKPQAGCAALFLDRQMRVLACTDPAIEVSKLEWIRDSGRQDTVELATFAVGDSWYALPTANVIEAVDARSLQSLPKTQAWCAGYLMFAGEPIVVADLARLLGITNIETPRVIVVVRTPGQPRPLGLLVESLGDIPEVARERLLPIEGLRDQSASLLVEHALEGTDPRDPMVMVLNARRLVALLRGEALEQAVEAAA